jgi:hypothetical protein
MQNSGQVAAVLQRLWVAAPLGAFLGAAVAAFAGMSAGAAAGWYNEATASGHAYEDLFVGFAEYSMCGMAQWSFMICGVLGFIGGGFCGSVAAVTRRAWLACAAAGLLFSAWALWESVSLLELMLKQAPCVWLFGMSMGSMISAIVCKHFPFCAIRITMVKEEQDEEEKDDD